MRSTEQCFSLSLFHMIGIVLFCATHVLTRSYCSSTNTASFSVVGSGAMWRRPRVKDRGKLDKELPSPTLTLPTPSDTTDPAMTVDSVGGVFMQLGHL